MKDTRTIERTIVRAYSVAGETFIICRDNKNEYWGFNEKDIDENGKTNRAYNGITGNHGKTMIETMRMCYQSARVAKEIDRELLNQNDIAEVMKIMRIVEDSFLEIA